MVQPAYNNNAIAQKVTMLNFAPQTSWKMTTSGTSDFTTFSPLTSQLRTTLKITNKGTTNGAYIAWGAASLGTVTAVASQNKVPASNCDYIGPGAILTQDFDLVGGPPVDTIAVIQDAGATTLEFSYGPGQ